MSAFDFLALECITMSSRNDFRDILRLREQCRRYDEEPIRETSQMLETLSLDDAVYPYERNWSSMIMVNGHFDDLLLTKFVEVLECMRRLPFLHAAKPLLRIEGGFDLGYGRELRFLCVGFPYVPAWSDLEDASYETLINGLEPLMREEAGAPANPYVGGLALQMRGPFSYRVLLEALEAMRSCGFAINYCDTLSKAYVLWCVDLAISSVPEDIKKMIVVYLR